MIFVDRARMPGKRAHCLQEVRTGMSGLDPNSRPRSLFQHAPPSPLSATWRVRTLPRVARERGIW